MEIKRAAVLGSGVMGPGIALSFAIGGVEVSLIDLDAQALKKGWTYIDQSLDLFVQKKVIPLSEKEGIRKRIDTTTDLNKGVQACHLVIEAVTENPEVKRKALLDLDQSLSPDAVIGSNTSSYPVPEMFPDIRPGKLIIIHYFNPPHIMPLVEMVKSKDTPENVVTTLRDFYRSLGKYVIVLNKFMPGFLVNRMQIGMMRELFYLLELGAADVSEIDTAFKCCSALRGVVSGPFEHLDMVGLDTVKMAATFLFPGLSNMTQVPDTIEKMVSGGRLGFKSGEGFYQYPLDEREAIRLRRDVALLEEVQLFKKLVQEGKIRVK
jgi:3-hydroxyacyl-CoA dehydrogenase